MNKTLVAESDRVQVLVFLTKMRFYHCIPTNSRPIFCGLNDLLFFLAPLPRGIECD